MILQNSFLEKQLGDFFFKFTEDKWCGLPISCHSWLPLYENGFLPHKSRQQPVGGKRHLQSNVCISYSCWSKVLHPIWAAWCFHTSRAALSLTMKWGWGPALRLGLPVGYGLFLPTPLVAVPLHSLRQKPRPAGQCGLTTAPIVMLCTPPVP